MNYFYVFVDDINVKSISSLYELTLVSCTDSPERGIMASKQLVVQWHLRRPFGISLNLLGQEAHGVTNRLQIALDLFSLKILMVFKNNYEDVKSIMLKT